METPHRAHWDMYAMPVAQVIVWARRSGAVPIASRPSHWRKRGGRAMPVQGLAHLLLDSGQWPVMCMLDDMWSMGCIPPRNWQECLHTSIDWAFACDVQHCARAMHQRRALRTGPVWAQVPCNSGWQRG